MIAVDLCVQPPNPLSGKDSGHSDAMWLKEGQSEAFLGIPLIFDSQEKTTFFLSGRIAKPSVAVFLPHGEMLPAGGDNEIGQRVKTNWKEIRQRYCVQSSVLIPEIQASEAHS